MAGVVQCAALGEHGRWGNALFQASFCRAYAELHDAQLQIPENWIGRQLFEGWEGVAPIGNPLPRTKDDVVPWGETNFDFLGYYQRQQCVDLLSRKKLREWFKFKPEVLAKYPRPRKLNYEYCAWHLRLEDYTSNPHFASIYTNITMHSYCRAYEKFGRGLPIVTVSADWTRDEWNAPVALNDFFLQMRSTVLFRANSTFSWWAGVLGDCEVFSPIIQGGGEHDCRFVPGNHPRFVDLPTCSDLHLAE